MYFGGVWMAKETVQAVRQAELNAVQIEKDANTQREAILLEAQQNAKTMITSMTKEAIAKAESDLGAAKHQGTETLEAAKLRAETEVLLIKEMIKEKEQSAIDLVLSNVI